MKPGASFILACALLSFCFSSSLPAQTDQVSERRTYRTARLNGEPLILDGRLDDPAWELVRWSSEFLQRDPHENAPPTAQTQFKVLYDDEALYFGFRCYDDPSLVADMLARRDWFPGDWIEVNIDSYHDQRTAYSFTLSLSGVRGDEYISEDGNNWDSSWDPVWEGTTQMDEEGWTAETRIPLSQLRFNNHEEDQTWGLQVQRRIFRKEERSAWQPIPKDQTGWVSRFGELQGLQGIRPPPRIELLPYVKASHERFEAEAGNPFRDGTDWAYDGGLDGKIGLGSDLTLDLTVNPDFGQVEADPSEVNLTAFETYFQERRPFFIEGASILDLPVAPAITGGFFTRDNLFYSRRIGKRPSHGPDVVDGEHYSEPDFTRIQGAFKLSGTTSRGLSVGILGSLTAEEMADIVGPAGSRQQTVEPATSFFVGRLQQDFGGGNTQLGAVLTSAQRRLDGTDIKDLPRQAYSGGLDFHHYLHDRDYRLEVRAMGSHLNGNMEAIDLLQTSSRRYYQRPDNHYVTYDPTRTSLSGHGGSVLFQRTSNSRFIGQTGVAWRSPGFELNDVGYLRSADGINQFTWVGYRWRNPFLVFRSFSVNGNQWLNWDYGGNFLSAAANTNWNAHFMNNYWIGGNLTYTWEHISNHELRGGPASKWPAELEVSFWLNSDSRHTAYYGFGGYLSQKANGGGRYREVWLDLTLRPSNALRVSLSPSYSDNWDDMQYVWLNSNNLDEDRYLFGTLDQQTARLTCRVDLCVTPDLTIQYYAQPFVSTGRYRDFKRITDPRADAYRDRSLLLTDDQITYAVEDNLYQVDEIGDDRVDYDFYNPDFDFLDFNSNLVVRWEYHPGSLIYLVWSQARSGHELQTYGFEIDRRLVDVFGTHPQNVFLVKISRWLSL